MARPADASRPDDRGSDWTVQAADAIERVVGGIRDKTSVPLTTVARALVYGVLVAVMGIAVVVFVAIVAVRFADSYIPGGVWAPYLILGGILSFAGALLLRKASSATGSKGNGRS